MNEVIESMLKIMYKMAEEFEQMPKGQCSKLQKEMEKKAKKVELANHMSIQCRQQKSRSVIELIEGK